MAFQTNYQRKGKKYSKISYKKRMQLIDMIIKQGATITGTSKKLHIKLPTAKAILASYRKHNHVFQRKKQNQCVQGPSEQVLSHEEHQIKENNPIQTQQPHLLLPHVQIDKNIQNIRETYPMLNYSYPIQIYYPNMNFWGCFSPQIYF